MKKLLIASGVVIVLVVVAGAVLLSNLDRVVASKKGYILEQAELRVGRAVAVDDIKVGWWPGLGVSLKNVRVADDPAFSGEPFVHVADLRVNVKVLPLLKKKVEVKRLVLGEPTITLIADESGRRNVDSMIEATGGSAGAGGAGAAESGAAAAAVVLAYADVEAGRLRVVDRAKGIDHTVGDIHFTARDLSLDSEVSFEFSAALVSDQRDVRVEGRAGPAGRVAAASDLSDVPVDVTVEIGPIAVPQALAMIPANPELAKLDALRIGGVEARFSVRGTVGALRVEDLVARAAITGADDYNVTVNATLGGLNPLAGFDANAVEVRGNLDAGPIALSSLPVPAPAPGAGAAPELGGTVRAEVTFEGRMDGMKVEAVVDATEATVRVGESFRKSAGVPARATLTGELREAGFDIAKSDVTFHTLRLSGAGQIVTAPGSESFDVSLTSEPTDVSKWGDLIPALAAASPRGTVTLRARVSGTPRAATPPRVEGTLTLAGGGAVLAQVPQPVTDAAATVSFTKTSARVEKASLTIGKSVLHATVNATALEPLEATYRVTSERVWRADVQEPVGAPTQRPEVFDQIVAEGRLKGVSPERVDHAGTFSSARGVVADLDYTDLSASFHSEGDAIVIDRYAARMLDGTVEGSGRLEPKSVPPRFDIRTSVKQVDVAKYLELKVPAVGRLIEGRIDLDLNVAGAGTEWKDIAKTLEGSGGGVVVKGALLNVNIVNELIAGLEAGVPLLPAGFADRVRQKNPKLFSDNRTVFENLKGSIQIQGGRVNAAGLLLKAADFSIAGDGWLAFDRSMDLKTTVVFSPKVSADIVAAAPIAKYLLDAEGRFALPLSLVGDIMKPRVGMDANALSARVQQSAVDQGRDRIKDQVKEGVKDLLGGFGKKKTDDKKGTAPADTTR